MNTFLDYYALLGIPEDAPPSAIKAGFKKLALQYHPDVYKGDDAHERMRELLTAYQTLNDPEERKIYDARRAQHLQNGRHFSTTGQGVSRRPAKSTQVSPLARRDRLRYYDFPTLDDGLTEHVDLVDMAYTLSPQQASALRSLGMLRGSMAKAEQDAFYCHRCRHRWSCARGSEQKNLPMACPKCHAADWSEYLLLRCVHCRAVFESEQIRYEIGTYNYGKTTHSGGIALCPPYELFPLCPYCGVAHWCPAEDERVSDLRARARHRAAVIRVAFITSMTILIVIIGSLLLVGLR
ncbi:MAG: DnaJ domain-containing protein [Ktedonobacteraceae bacterium]|nr:DnaJ domain-containing protein [Ktedonobacteraceae bacterium]